MIRITLPAKLGTEIEHSAADSTAIKATLKRLLEG